MEKVIIVHANVKESEIEVFLDLTQHMIKQSIAESGCLTYQVSRNITTENEFIFYEKYENENAVNLHNTSKHFKEFIASVTPLLTQPPIIENY